MQAASQRQGSFSCSLWRVNKPDAKHSKLRVIPLWLAYASMSKTHTKNARLEVLFEQCESAAKLSRFHAFLINVHSRNANICAKFLFSLSAKMSTFGSLPWQLHPSADRRVCGQILYAESPLPSSPLTGNMGLARIFEWRSFPLGGSAVIALSVPIIGDFLERISSLFIYDWKMKLSEHAPLRVEGWTFANRICV